MNLTTEERSVGRDNYYEAVGVTRRDFLRGVVGAGAVTGVGLGAMYFGYGDQSDPNKGLAKPLRIGVIGTGDEGGVLIGSLNPNYVQVVAIADIRPYSIHRAFHGDCEAGPARPGLMSRYGWKSEDEAKKNVKVYDKDFRDLLKDENVEAVIIALPLFLHHVAAIEAMKHGKHVLTEKLMAHNIGQCKEMGRVAKAQNLYLATGHQRHYSVLYDNAVNLIKNNVLGELQFIRAQWHRGNLPGNDSWCPPIPGGEKAANGKVVDKIAEKLKGLRNKLAELDKEAQGGRRVDPAEYEKLKAQAAQWTAWDADKVLADSAQDYGYQGYDLDGGRKLTPFGELCRWRLWDRTGGGLMAELGSHQLDAASIFCSALRTDGKHAHPIAVHGTGGRHVFPYDRDADDHVYCMFEFPGPGYEFGKDDDRKKLGYYDPIADYPPAKGIPSYNDDPNKKIIVTYSSIMGNPFGGYGELVMGSRGTLALEREQNLMLWPTGGSTTTRVKVSTDAGGATMNAYETGGPSPAAALAAAADSGPVSRGYTEEIEHWAWCIRNPSSENRPKCHPEMAMGDAICALTAKLAITNSHNEDPAVRAKSYIVFKDEWFDIDNDETPDGSKPRSAEETLKNPSGKA